MAEVKGIIFADSRAAGACLVKRAFVNVAAAQTDNAFVAAVANRSIRVIALVMETGGTATTVTFNSKPAGAGSAISPLFANAINGHVELQLNEHGWFQTVSGEGLTVTTGAGSTTGILINYIEV